MHPRSAPLRGVHRTFPRPDPQEDAIITQTTTTDPAASIALATLGPLRDRPLVEQIRNAFLLGASAAELAARIQLATLGSVTGDDAMWTASMWRVNFKRLAQLHAGFFPDSVSIGTLFDAGSDSPNYLFPRTAAPTELDYADVGIPKHDASGATLPDTFNLGEATRRGLNCLALACVDADASLAPEIVAEQQGRLATAIVGPVTGDLTDADRSARLGTVRSKLIPLILAYLRFWEWYLRERFFAAGVYAEDQTRLIAFEAGSSMTKLSWGLSIQIVSKPDLTAEQLAAIWTATFNDRDVSRLQHQLAVVGKAIGDATHDAKTGEDSGQSLQTVKRSLEYWQRTVQWLTDPALNGSIEMTRPAGNASDCSWWNRPTSGKPSRSARRIWGRTRPKPSSSAFARCGGVLRGHCRQARAPECRRPGWQSRPTRSDRSLRGSCDF